MKQTIIPFAFIVIVISTILLACSKEAPMAGQKPVTNVQPVQNARPNNLWLPPDSIIKNSTNHH